MPSSIAGAVREANDRPDVRVVGVLGVVRRHRLPELSPVVGPRLNGDPANRLAVEVREHAAGATAYGCLQSVSSRTRFCPLLDRHGEPVVDAQLDSLAHWHFATPPRPNTAFRSSPLALLAATTRTLLSGMTLCLAHTPTLRYGSADIMIERCAA